MSKSSMSATVLAGLAAAILCAGSAAAQQKTPRTTVEAVADEEEIGAQGTFETVYNLVKEHYVDKLPTDTVMTRGAVRAMIASLGD